MTKRKLIFTTPLLEYPPAGGPYLRIFNSIKALSIENDIYLYTNLTLAEIGGKTALQELNKYCKFIRLRTQLQLSESTLEPRLNRLKINLYKHSIIRLAYVFSTYFFRHFVVHRNTKLALDLVNFAKQMDIGIIWFGYGNITVNLIEQVRNLDERIQTIADTDSVWSRFILRKLPHSKSFIERTLINLEGKIKQAQEFEMCRCSDVITAVSEVDADYYRDLCSDRSKIFTFSNCIDVEAYIRKVNKHFNPTIVFSGYFGVGSPTDHGARWFIKNVLPKIIDQIPDVSFKCIGRDADVTLKDIENDNIEVVGRVQDIASEIARCHVSVVPLFFESGTRFKILEAGALKVPVVSTTLGAEGLDLVAGHHILIADDAKSFASAIIRLLKKEEFSEKVSNSLHEHVVKLYSLKTLSKQSNQVFDYLGNV